jgi:hypothetical protein
MAIAGFCVWRISPGRFRFREALRYTAPIMSIDASPANADAGGAGTPRAHPGPPLPYASPIPLAQAGDLFRGGPDDDLLVVRDGVTLPEKCVLCGKLTTKAPILLRFSWDASFRLTRRSHLQLGLKGSVRAHLCPLHRGHWVVGRLAGLAGVAVGFLLTVTGGVIAAISESSTVPWYTPLGIELMIAGFAVLNVALFYFAIRTRTLSCKRIEGGYLYLDGAAEEFLRDLPQAPVVERPDEE